MSNIRIKQNAAENSVDVDGTKFDMPTDKDQRDGIRELVVNYWCRVNGFAPLFPDVASRVNVK